MTVPLSVTIVASYIIFVRIGSGGHPFAHLSGHMTLSVNPRVRRKAVWGAKALGLAFSVVLSGVATDVAAAPKYHRRQAEKARPGVPGAHVKQYKLDDELSRRADDLNPRHTTRVIVTLVPGATLPNEFKKFVDFVNGRALPYDDNGHGTHVAGIIAGNGYDSRGEKSGIAPEATIVSLKVLNAEGKGTISSIIAALNWVAANGAAYNIRVVNMSVGAGVYESYWTDPLTLAAKAVTDKGITVVTAAGNLGKNAQGHLQYGGITAPGNAPWVLTVGASSTIGTFTRTDDQMAAYSSSGPTKIHFEAQPDLVAPGTGTVSLAVPGSTVYTTKAAYLPDGTRLLGPKPYLPLSGTSMAAPAVV